MSFPQASLADVCAGRDNNFNLIRVVAALCVLVSHAWAVSFGAAADQPLSALLGRSLGSLAVFVFFCISGFLVSQSFDRRMDARRWLSARALRLFPGLAVALLWTVLVIGPLATDRSLPAYFADQETHSYVFNNLSLVFRQGQLPGVFEGNAIPGETNGSLWTLLYEVLCYSFVLVLGTWGVLRSRPAVTAVLVLFLVALAASQLLPKSTFPHVARTGLVLGLPFAIGVAFYVWRSYIVLNPVLLLAMALATVAVRTTPMFEPALVATICYGTFILAFLPKGAVRRYNSVGDYSYGVYIYAWPVQQSVAEFLGVIGPALNIAIAAPLTLLMAVPSWYLVEKPALSLARRPAAVRTIVQAKDALQ